MESLLQQLQNKVSTLVLSLMSKNSLEGVATESVPTTTPSTNCSVNVA